MKALRKTLTVLMGFGLSLLIVLYAAVPIGSWLNDWLRHGVRLPDGFESIAAAIRTFAPGASAIALTVA